MADAAELQTHVRAMKAHTREELADAVAKYEKEVWARGSEVVEANRQNTLALHNWETVKQSFLVVRGVNPDTAGLAGEGH